MKVLAVPSYSGLGGQELHLAAFAANRPRDVEVKVLALEDGPLVEHLRSRGLDVRAASGLEGRPGPRQLASFSRTLGRVLRAERPDVVWASGQKAALLACPICRLRRVPVVWHKVDFSFDRWLTKPLGLAANGVITVSDAVAEPLGALRDRRLLGVVGVPIELPDGLALTPASRPPAIGALSRLLPYKGLHHILAAAGVLAEEFPDLRVVFAGGPVPEYPGYGAELVAQAQRLGLAERLDLLGFVPDVATVLERLTVFVSATHQVDGFGLEGLGAGLLEASWAGLPVVAFRQGGTAEAVRDGVTGTLVDSVEADVLARAIAPFLRDPALARRYGEPGRAFARERCAPPAASARLFGALAKAAGR